MLMIITAILKRSSAPSSHVSMVIPGGQDVKGLGMIGFVLLWDWERDIGKSIYVCWLLTVRTRTEWGASGKCAGDFQSRGTWRRGTGASRPGNANTVFLFSEESYGDMESEIWVSRTMQICVTNTRQGWTCWRTQDYHTRNDEKRYSYQRQYGGPRHVAETLENKC